MVRERLRALPRTLARSWPGRLLLAGALAKVLLLPFVTDGGSLLVWVDVSASLALAVGLGHLLLQSVAGLRRRLLWRVRRKLFLSYVFIGFVPVLLVAAFFAVAGAMSVLSASSEIVRHEIDGVIADVRVAAAGIGARLSSGNGRLGRAPAAGAGAAWGLPRGLGPGTPPRGGRRAGLGRSLVGRPAPGRATRMGR